MPTPRPRPWKLAALALILTGSAAAQSNPTANPAASSVVTLPSFTVSSGKDTSYIGAEALSTMRAGVPLLDTPQSVVVLNRAFIDDMNPSILADTLAYVGGAQIGNINFSVDRYALRGFASEGDYRDGFRVYSDANADLADVDHLEIVKGPAPIFIANSGQTGGQPVGGVINKISKGPTDYQVGTFKLQAGAFDGDRAELDLGGPLGGGWTYRLVAAGQDAAGYYRDSYVHRMLIEPSLAYRFGPDSKLVVRYSYANTHFSSYNGLPWDQRTASVLGVDPATNFDDKDFNWRHDVINRVSAEFTTKLNEHVEARVAAFSEHTFASRVESVLANVVPFAGAASLTQNPGGPTSDTAVVNGQTILLGGVPTDFVNGQGMFTRSTTAQSNYYRNSVIQNDYVAAFGGEGLSSRTVAGIEYIDQPTRNVSFAGINNPAYTIAGSAQSSSPIDPFNAATFGGPVGINYATPSSQVNTSVQTGKLYALETLGLWQDRFQVTAGAIRTFTTASVLNELTAATTLPSQTIWKNLAQYNFLFKVTDQVSAFYGYSQNFAASAGTTSNTNQLVPSFGEQKEGGLKTQGLWHGRLTLEAAYFQLSQTNLTVPAFPATTPPSFIVVPGETSKGVDGDAYFQVSANLDLIGSFADFKAVDEVIVNGAPVFGPVNNVGEHSYGLWGRYKFTQDPVRGLAVALGVNHLSRRAVTNNANNVWYGYVPGRTLANLSLTYDAGHFRYALNVDNLLDQRYIEDVRSVQIVIPGETANLKGSVTYRF